MNWEPKKFPVDLLYCSGLELAVSLRSQFTYLQKKWYIIYPGLSLFINKKKDNDRKYYLKILGYSSRI